SKMKSRFFLGCIGSVVILVTSPLLAILANSVAAGANPVAAIADDNSVIWKVVLLDLFQRVTGESRLLPGGGSEIEPGMTKITFVDAYALVSWVWGDGGGQTVLVKENERWRAIVAGSGELRFSTLVQYKIPRDTARSLINRDKGAPEKQPPVADLFIDLLPQLQEKTDALILLPSELPMSKQPIYLRREVASRSYRINLVLTRNCDGSNPCTVGSFIANPVAPVYEPGDMFIKDVALANSIRGYFTPSRCDGAFCTPAKIEWDWEGFSYKIELKRVGRDVNEEEVVMIAIANSAIIAGPR
ncbi:hypothetical protein, partial [Limnofasciculus baicalensis]